MNVSEDVYSNLLQTSINMQLKISIMKQHMKVLAVFSADMLLQSSSQIYMDYPEVVEWASENSDIIKEGNEVQKALNYVASLDNKR